MFSKPCKYALRAILYLGRESSADDKLGVQQIAEALNIPKHYLAKILQRLSKHRLITSIKGPKGGFYLNDKNLSHSLLHVIECMDGSHTLNSCILGLPECSGVNPCPMHMDVMSWRNDMISKFERTTIREAVEHLSHHDYQI